MKKLFTLMMLAIAVMTAKATDYTDTLLVVVDGVSFGQKATISVTQNGDLYDLNLKNFMLMNDDSPLPVGNVELKNIVPEQSGDAIILHAEQTIKVTNGDLDGVDFWLGTVLDELPVDLTAVLENNKLRAIINLEVVLGKKQIINVSFGKEQVVGYHIPNGGFEEWHISEGSNVEPNSWHSFESATGDYKGVVTALGTHIEKSENGINDTNCARIFSSSLLGIIANGTMTTGRMNAGSKSANSTANHAYLDISKTDTDGNGDPFYVTLTHRPDALVLWVKFKQGTPNKKHPYATVSAVITDGTYYQDPEDTEYSNVVGKAKNSEIAETNGEWERISIPFNYKDDNDEVKPQAILVTISTNADPGQGSKGDEVLVDNLTLVYNSKLGSLNVNGFSADVFEYETEGLNFNNITATPIDPEAYVLKSLEQREDGEYAVVKVYSADLCSSNTYTIKLNSGSTSIISIPTSAASSADTYYNIDGTQVTSPQKGRVVIVRKADGSTMKVVR